MQPKKQILDLKVSLDRARQDLFQVKSSIFDKFEFLYPYMIMSDSFYYFSGPKDLFCFTFQVNLFSHYFSSFRKKGLRPKYTIYKHESDKNTKCLSVSNFRILSFVIIIVVCDAPTTAYVKTLKYLLKKTNIHRMCV